MTEFHLLSFPNTGGPGISTYTLETFWVFRLLTMDFSLGKQLGEEYSNLRLIIFYLNRLVNFFADSCGKAASELREGI